MKVKFCLVSLIHSAIAAAIKGVPKSYAGYQLLKVNVQQADLIHDLFTSPDHSIWREYSALDGQVHVMVPPKSLPIASQFQSQTLIDDIQDRIDEERSFAKLHSDVTASRVMNKLQVTSFEVFADFQDAEVYVAYLLSFPGTEKVVIGKSYLGQDIVGIRFGSGERNIVAHGGIHAREWISPATATYVASELLGDSADAILLRSKFTFTYIPVLNVDGYAFTRAKNGDRLWRKNRQPTSNKSCLGVDPNRNFPTGWSKPGASSSPCSETYYGSAALSAPESAALYNYVLSLKNAVSYMDFHSYSELWMFPYGSDCKAVAKDYNLLNKASIIATSAISAVNSLNFKFGPICSTIYQASGGSIDAIYDIGVKYSFTAELRDTGRYGFVLPAAQILDSGKEMSAAMFALYKFIIDN